MQNNVSLLFKALSDPSRMKIFHSLVVLSTVLSISQITTNFNMSRQGVTKHLKILEKASLIDISVMGRERYCKANPEALLEFKKWLSFYEQFWDSSLSNLSSYLDEPEV